MDDLVQVSSVKLIKLLALESSTHTAGYIMIAAASWEVLLSISSAIAYSHCKWSFWFTWPCAIQLLLVQVAATSPASIRPSLAQRRKEYWVLWEWSSSSLRIQFSSPFFHWHFANSLSLSLSIRQNCKKRELKRACGQLRRRPVTNCKEEKASVSVTCSFASLFLFLSPRFLIQCTISSPD